MVPSGTQPLCSSTASAGCIVQHTASIRRRHTSQRSRVSCGYLLELTERKRPPSCRAIRSSFNILLSQRDRSGDPLRALPTRVHQSGFSRGRESTLDLRRARLLTACFEPRLSSHRSPEKPDAAPISRTTGARRLHGAKLFRCTQRPNDLIHLGLRLYARPFRDAHMAKVLSLSGFQPVHNNRRVVGHRLTIAE
jgi:hypothetical protein